MANKCNHTGRTGDKIWYLIRLNLAKDKAYIGTYITKVCWRYRLSNCGNCFAIFIWVFLWIGDVFCGATVKLRSGVHYSGNSSELLQSRMGRVALDQGSTKGAALGARCGEPKRGRKAQNFYWRQNGRLCPKSTKWRIDAGLGPMRCRGHWPNDTSFRGASKGAMKLVDNKRGQLALIQLTRSRG